MLQDLTSGKLYNEFRHVQPTPGDIVICFRDDQVLLQRFDDNALALPEYSVARKWVLDNAWGHWREEEFQYIFCLQNVNYFLWMGSSGACPNAAFAYEPVRTLRQLLQ